MHNVRCANSKAIRCECSCQGALHGTKGTGRKIPVIPEEPIIDIKNMFCSVCGNIFQPANNIVIKGTKTIIRCPHCAKEWKI